MPFSSRSSQVSEIINLYMSSSPRLNDKNLTSRPLYRLSRQQPNLEDGRTAQAVSRQKSMGRGRKPDPEMIERVIKDLEDVLQEAVSIAQNVRSDSTLDTSLLSTAGSGSAISDFGTYQTNANVRNTNEAIAPDNPSKKRSSDFSNFIKEYHHTLTWLSNRDHSGEASPTLDFRFSTSAFPTPDAHHDQLQKEFKENVFSDSTELPTKRTRTASLAFSLDTGVDVSPHTDKQARLSANASAATPLPSPAIQLQTIPQVNTRDFAMPSPVPDIRIIPEISTMEQQSRDGQRAWVEQYKDSSRSSDEENQTSTYNGHLGQLADAPSHNYVAMAPPRIRPRISSKRFKTSQIVQEQTHNSDGGNDSEHVPFILGSHRRKDGAQKDVAVDRSKQELKAFQSGLRRHHSFGAHAHFSLHRARGRAVIARDWSIGKKRYTATVACVSTSLIGLIIGIYAGEVPAIQYAIVDEGTQYAILGNVVFYLGLALSTAISWPIPLLFGRKKFTLGALCLLLSLQFPQALVVMQQRVPYVYIYRAGLLLPRGVSGLVIGFANMNFMAILLDLFGASLQSGNPHQEIVVAHDVRRHGGGMGVWLGIWTWCHIGSIGVGFLIGAVIIGFINISWGFWLVIIATVVVILLNLASPETRIPAYRNSVAEVAKGRDISRRVGRGEIMMHLYSEGPLHWWEEVQAGMVLSLRMLKQPGFIIMTLYEAWVYGQVVMVMILLAALASKYYYLLPQYVALCVGSFPLGALLAVPFQKASLFSRSRHHAQRTDSMTFEKRVSWSSHMVRRSFFMVSLPLASITYTVVSSGPPVSLALPVVFSGIIGFLTNLALCECYGLIMETFDTSDLQPGMTGRPRREVSEEVLHKQTNFSCFPRVTAGFAIVQTASFAIAAAATAVGGSVERSLGAEAATGVVAGVLVFLTLLLIAALTRFRTVQVVPSNRVGTATLSGPGDDLPIVIGNPSGTNRRISLLELGSMSRWTEIRRRNKLIGSQSHE